MSPQLWLPGHLAPEAVSGLCRRAQELLATSEGDLVCDVIAFAEPDLLTVHALAMLRLVARRTGRGTRLREASPELCRLLHLCGLTAVLPCVAGQDGGVAGNPKSGNSDSVSRKNENSTI